MDALKVRDQIFSDIHVATIKPLGYRKKGHWSIKSLPPFHWAAYLRASRFGNRSHAVFWVDLQVFHEDWDSLVSGPRPFPALYEGLPHLVGEELGAHCVPSIRTIEIDESTNVPVLTEILVKGMAEYGLPLFERCSSLEDILAYYTSKPEGPQFAYSAAAICLLLDREAQAKEYMQLAKATAPHANSLQWLERKEAAMWSNFRSSGRAESARRSP